LCCFVLLKTTSGNDRASPEIVAHVNGGLKLLKNNDISILLPRFYLNQLRLSKVFQIQELGGVHKRRPLVGGGSKKS